MHQTLERFELVWAAKDGQERCFPVVDVLTFGRGARNDVVLPVDEVSWEHARVWVEGRELFVSDSGSTNGTFVDERQITDRTSLSAGSTIRFGPALRLEVRQVAGAAVPIPEESWLIEDMNTGVRRPFNRRFVVGGDPDADLRVPGARRLVFRVEHEEVHVEENGEERAARVGEVFDVGAGTVRLLEERRRTPERTVRPAWETDALHVEATLAGRHPYARIYDEDGAELRVEGETRATLVYVLAQAVSVDRKQGVAVAQCGWLDDLDAVTRVWGRTAPSEVSNRLSVVVYRLRSGLKTRGLASNFIERERGRIRLRCGRISLEG